MFCVAPTEAALVSMPILGTRALRMLSVIIPKSYFLENEFGFHVDLAVRSFGSEIV